MASIAEFLGADHQSCHELYASAEAAVAAGQWDLATKKGERFTRALTVHFRMEEDVLFPAFEEATGMFGSGPPAVMRAEHVQMRELLERLSVALVAKDSPAWLSAGETLLVMMQQHDMKEEGILYPMADDVLGGEAGDIVARLAEVRDRG